MEELVIKLLINGFGLATEVHPVFGDDVKIKIDREENQIFRRETIEGTFQFSGDDFALSMDAPFILPLLCRFSEAIPS